MPLESPTSTLSEILPLVAGLVHDIWSPRVCEHRHEKWPTGLIIEAAGTARQTPSS
jgi:hypothetical protein